MPTGEFFSINRNSINLSGTRLIHSFSVIKLNRLQVLGTEGASKNPNTFFEIINITVDSTIVTVDSTLYNRRIDACATVELAFVKPSSQGLCSRRFDSRFQTLIYMPFPTWIHFIFSSFTSYLDVSYYRNKKN